VSAERPTAMADDDDELDPHAAAAERARAERRAERARRREARAAKAGAEPPDTSSAKSGAERPTTPAAPTAAEPPDAERPGTPAAPTAAEPPDAERPGTPAAPTGAGRLRTWAVQRVPSGLLATTSGRVLCGAFGALALLTVIGLVALWPGDLPGGEQQAFGGRTRAAEVTATRVVGCPGPAAQRCRQIGVRVTDGPDTGRRATLDLGPVTVTPALEPGDKVRVQRSEAGGAGGYDYVDVDRRLPILWLAIVLAVLAVAVARWRGALALLGVGLSLVLVVTFLVPAILNGSDPVLVSLVAALAVMFVTLLLTYGPGAQSLAAALGIGLSLLLAALVGHAFVDATHLDGRTGELPVAALGVSLQGIVLAGMVIGALGVLTDMAVSQASAVTALRQADPSLGPRALYRGAFAVGRDHLSATIHTLVLAYVGAALPLILVLRDAHVGFTDSVNGQIVAEPVVATLVGAIALVAAVPLTTALAAVLVARVPTGALEGHRGHAH
jgi:uncharacterized membrane protein